MQGFSLTFNQLFETSFRLCNPVTFNTKTVESIDLLQLLVDDRKVFTAKVKANIGKVMTV